MLDKPKVVNVIPLIQKAVNAEFSKDVPASDTIKSKIEGPVLDALLTGSSSVFGDEIVAVINVRIAAIVMQVTEEAQTVFTPPTKTTEQVELCLEKIRFINDVVSSAPAFQKSMKELNAMVVEFHEIPLIKEALSANQTADSIRAIEKKIRYARKDIPKILQQLETVAAGFSQGIQKFLLPVAKSQKQSNIVATTDVYLAQSEFLRAIMPDSSLHIESLKVIEETLRENAKKVEADKTKKQKIKEIKKMLNSNKGKSQGLSDCESDTDSEDDGNTSRSGSAVDLFINSGLNRLNKQQPLHRVFPGAIADVMRKASSSRFPSKTGPKVGKVPKVSSTFDKLFGSIF